MVQNEEAQVDFIHYNGQLSNIMDTSVTAVNEKIAAQLLRLRSLRALSLQALSELSGVSRSMISLIERAKASPTAVVLERLATALGVPLAQLFDLPNEAGGEASPVARRRHQAEWQDPGSGYLRRNVSPAERFAPFRIVEVEFPAGARVAFETTVRNPPLHQQVWVLAGQICVAVGSSAYELERGDCLSMCLDQPIVFSNPGGKSARYAVIVSSAPDHGLKS